MITVEEPALLIRIAKLFREGMTAQEIYEATRGVWRLGGGKDSAKYALTVANGICQEVYVIGTWHAAGSTTYNTRPLSQVSIPGRWEFVGSVAPQQVRTKYIGRSLSHYFAKGNASPVNYVNIKR
jgi:hypothetical protein